MQTYTIPVTTYKTVQGIFVRSNGDLFFICLEDDGNASVQKANLYLHVTPTQSWMKIKTIASLHGTFTDDSLLKLFFDSTTAHITTVKNDIVL